MNECKGCVCGMRVRTGVYCFAYARKINWKDGYGWEQRRGISRGFPCSGPKKTMEERNEFFGIPKDVPWPKSREGVCV